MASTRKKREQTQAQPARDSKSRTPLPVWKKALFAVFTFVVFFGLVEFSLYLAGVKPLLFDEDPYVGFASQIPLFVEQENGDRGDQMVTARNKLRFFNQQQFPKKKNSGVTRVFCLGGSTTYGRPYDDTTSFCGWLRELLPVADSSRGWEVINAGGISYASYRVAALMEEISDYQPDLVIVYCGHNEFLERRTYSGIIDTPAPIRGLGMMLSNTRTYSAMARMFRKKPVAQREQSEQLAGEVDTILDKSVGPKDYQRDPDLKEQVLSHYRFNMSRIVDIVRASGAEVIFVTPASNLRHCSPFKSQSRDGLNARMVQQWDALYASALVHFDTKRFSDALRDLDQAAKIDDQQAKLHYLRGRVLDGLKQFEEARVAYQRALDEDVCPLRSLSPMRDVVIDVAQKRNVSLVDFASLVENESPQGIAGEELFLDHVHPTISGHRLMAVAIIEEMGRQSMVSFSSDWNDAAVERVASIIMKRVDVKAQGVAMRNLSKVFAWAGKMDDAYRAAKKALELFPGDAETHYQVGNLALHLGKTDEAVERLKYLVSFDLKPEVTFYVKAHLQLATILSERGDYAACERVLQRLMKLDPDNAPGQQQWAHLLLLQGAQLTKNGKLTEATEKLSEVVRLQPDNFDAKLQLAVAHVRARNYVAAVSVLEKMIDARPEYLAAYDNLSFVLAQLGRLDDAEKVCRQSLKIDPNHEAGQRNLQIILKKKSQGN